METTSSNTGSLISFSYSVGQTSDRFATSIADSEHAVVVTLLTEINYLNKALELFNTAMVTPIYFVLFTGCSKLRHHF